MQCMMCGCHLRYTDKIWTGGRFKRFWKWMRELCSIQSSYRLKFMALLEIQAFTLIMVFWEDTCH